MLKPPISERLRVYKAALQHYKNNCNTNLDNGYYIFSEGLCIVLICFLENKYYQDCEHSWRQSDDLFPEFGKIHEGYYECNNKYRISILQQIIKDIENGTTNN